MKEKMTKKRSEKKVVPKTESPEIVKQEIEALRGGISKYIDKNIKKVVAALKMWIK
jgi:hypothetical protein